MSFVTNLHVVRERYGLSIPTHGHLSYNAALPYGRLSAYGYMLITVYCILPHGTRSTHVDATLLLIVGFYITDVDDIVYNSS